MRGVNAGWLLFVVVVLGAQSSIAAEPALVDAAKKEGRLTWYTTQIVDQLARPAAEAFEKKYAIHVDLVRTDSAQLLLRIVNEAHAGNVQADVIDATDATLALKKDNLIENWLPDSAKDLPPQFVDRDGYWAAASANTQTIAFNTDMVSEKDQPKHFADLLDKKWANKLVWGASPLPSAAAGFIGTVLAAMGDDDGMNYLRKLATQKVVGIEQSARQVLDQVVAGEYPVALQFFNNHAAISAAKGAPVKWAALEASMVHLLVFAVPVGSPHPNAGKLFEDFMVSKDGQKIFRDANYLTVDPDVPPKDPSLRLDENHFHAIYFTPEQLELSMPKWMAIYKQLFQY